MPVFFSFVSKSNFLRANNPLMGTRSSRKHGKRSYRAKRSRRGLSKAAKVEVKRLLHATEDTGRLFGSSAITSGSIATSWLTTPMWGVASAIAQGDTEADRSGQCIELLEFHIDGNLSVPAGSPDYVSLVFLYDPSPLGVSSSGTGLSSYPTMDRMVANNTANYAVFAPASLSPPDFRVAFRKNFLFETNQVLHRVRIHKKFKRPLRVEWSSTNTAGGVVDMIRGACALHACCALGNTAASFMFSIKFRNAPNRGAPLGSV